MRCGVLRAYSGFSAGTGPTQRSKGDAQMYHGFDYGLGRERRIQMRKEVEHDRLQARLRSARREEEAKGGAFYAEIAPRRNVIARGASFAMALFR
jgi:hypothetical protein